MANKIAIRIDGMTCISCAEHVQAALQSVPGVRSAVVSYPESAAEIDVDDGVDHDAPTKSVAALGYRATLSGATTAEQNSTLPDKAVSRFERRNKSGSNGDNQRYTWL